MVVQGQAELCEFKAIPVYIVRRVTVIRGWRDGTGVEYVPELELQVVMRYLPSVGAETEFRFSKSRI